MSHKSEESYVWPMESVKVMRRHLHTLAQRHKCPIEQPIFASTGVPMRPSKYIQNNCWTPLEVGNVSDVIPFHTTHADKSVYIANSSLKITLGCLCSSVCVSYWEWQVYVKFSYLLLINATSVLVSDLLRRFRSYTVVSMFGFGHK